MEKQYLFLECVMFWLEFKSLLFLQNYKGLCWLFKTKWFAYSFICRWFLLPANLLQIESQIQFALDELKKCVFLLNEEKSNLIASNKKKFIGFIVETDVNANLVKISIPNDRITKVKKSSQSRCSVS